MKKLSLITLAIIGLTSQFTLADSLDGAFPPNDQTQPYTVSDANHPDDVGIKREEMDFYRALAQETSPEARCVKLSNTSVSRNAAGNASIRATISYFDESSNLLEIKHIKTSSSGFSLPKLSYEIPIPFALVAMPEEILHQIFSFATATARAEYYLSNVLDGKIKFQIPICSAN